MEPTQTIVGRLIKMWQGIELRRKGYGHYGERYKQRGGSITRGEFFLFVLTESDYLDIYTKWKESGFERSLVPSVDRIDGDRGYDLDNIQILSLYDNQSKG